RGGQWPERRLDTVGNVDLRQTLAHLLAREVEVGAVVEGKGDVGEAQEREGVHAGQAREPVHLALDRERHLPLYLLSRMPREEGNHLYLGIGELRKGLDGQAPEGGRTRDGEGGRQGDHERGVRERQREGASHLSSKARAIPTACRGMQALFGVFPAANRPARHPVPQRADAPCGRVLPRQPVNRLSAQREGGRREARQSSTTARVRARPRK